VRVCLAFILFLCVSLSNSGCGYSLAGRGTFLPGYIETIGIPLFVNDTTFFELEEMITNHVRTEFIGRGRYKVMAKETDVDALLTGSILSISVVPSGFTADRMVSRYTATVTSKIEFRDLTNGVILWENPGLVFSEEYDVTNVASGQDPGAFFGQNVNALERLANNFARSVVTSILEAF
jgi:hypothetical protein